MFSIIGFMSLQKIFAFTELGITIIFLQTKNMSLYVELGFWKKYRCNRCGILQGEGP